VFFQITVFLLSIPFFERIAFELMNFGLPGGANGTRLFTLLYACCPHIIYWNRCTLTESLAISGMVFFVYYMACYLRTNRTLHLLSLHVIVFLLIMLRPAFLYLLPVMVLFWSYNLIFLKRKLDFLKGVLLTVLTSLSLFFYAQKIQEKTGVFSLTIVSTVNKYTFFRQNGLLDNIDPSLPISVDITSFRNMDLVEEFSVLVDKYGYQGIENFLHFEAKKNCGNYLLKVLLNIQQNGRKMVFIPGGFQENDLSTTGEIILKAIVSINLFFVQLYLFLFIYALVFAVLFRRYIKKLALPLFLWIIVCAHIATIFLGSYGQYSRLIAPVYPLLLLMFGVLAGVFLRVIRGIVWKRVTHKRGLQS
jgi:hypothetical protein